MNKRQRQQMLRRLVRERIIGSQMELVDALRATGFVVTQATISRDLRELGLQKERDVTGRTRYVLVPTSEEKPDPQVACSRMLQEFGRGVDTAQNLLVVRCDPGAAPGLGRVIDELEHAAILGCVAGDDTVIIVAKDGRAAETVCAYLRELGG
ncbi:MAG: arginine repressor [Actinobacteria bacterium]|nr:arginine repressor [Actinomycetota bacterium]MCL5735581.1 arginine repressor [Actinomycetota bacterium]